MPIEWVFLDVGGILFSDASYFASLYEAIAAAAPDTTRAAFDERFDALRAGQSEPFTEALVSAFVTDPARHAEVRADADARWEARGYRAEELYPEVPSVLATLARDYKLACITNHFSWVRDRARDAGFAEHVGVWAISAEIGVEKPSPEIFEHALRAAGTDAGKAVMVGDRLDRDIAPAKSLGMRTVWVLRNEAPDDPTAEQLAVPDAAVRSLEEVPAIVAGWSR
ncbi:MAG: HAD family hydrolase [Actinomycetota bacterium]